MKTPINAGQTSFRLGLSAMFVGPEKAKTRLRGLKRGDCVVYQVKAAECGGKGIGKMLCDECEQNGWRVE